MPPWGLGLHETRAGSGRGRHAQVQHLAPAAEPRRPRPSGRPCSMR
ncbi:MAG: hypothetical protein MZV70_05080 [Desulfobacterales bacterium]|nr:hypothetical protein [Desulfobacterales bacterium]